MITRLVSVPKHSDSVISVLNFVKLNKSCKQHYSFVVVKLNITDKKIHLPIIYYINIILFSNKLQK